MQNQYVLAVFACLLVGCFVAAPVSAACTKKHPYVGLKGKLVELDHEVSGTITILDDCTFRVTGFNYDGKAPATYWWGAPAVNKIFQCVFVSCSTVSSLPACTASHILLPARKSSRAP
eukprot:jgi/Chrzof1/5428/Cz16g02190.t1